MKRNIYLFFIALISTFSVMGNGSDTKPKPDPTVDQSKVQLDVAFNGWVYETFATYDAGLGEGGITIRCSKSNGEFWETVDSYSFSGVEYSSLDLVVAGTDAANLTLFLVGVRHDLINSTYLIFIDRYDANSYSYIDSPLNTGVSPNQTYNVVMATDYRNPSLASSPYSIALAYSQTSPLQDSIGYYISIDGGTSFSQLPVANTSSYYRNLSIAYGKSASASNGRYFIAYEQLAFPEDRNGHIYSCHNQAIVNNYFTTPVRVDSFSLATSNNICRNPKISVQSNVIDNDSSGLTAVILLERDYLGDGTDYDILGYYNMVAHYSDYWNYLAIIDNSTNDIQPDISYDPANNNFLVTYLDSTNSILPYCYNNFNLASPFSWNYLFYTYVDNYSGLTNPQPKVVINPVVNQAAFAWSRLEGGNQVAYFDAEYSFIQPYTNTINGEYCNGTVYTYFGNSYTAGTYDFPATASNGLDSTTTLSLTELSNPFPAISAVGNVVSTQGYAAFQWYLNGVLIGGANAQSYTALVDGDYSVAVTDLNGCVGTSSSIFVNVNGVNDLESQGIHFFPNPSSEFITIDVNKFSTGAVTVNVIDALGKVVITEMMNGSKVVDLKSLSSGIYLLQFISGEKSAVTRLVKN